MPLVVIRVPCTNVTASESIENNSLFSFISTWTYRNRIVLISNPKFLQRTYVSEDWGRGPTFQQADRADLVWGMVLAGSCWDPRLVGWPTRGIRWGRTFETLASWSAKGRGVNVGCQSNGIAAQRKYAVGLPLKLFTGLAGLNIVLAHALRNCWNSPLPSPKLILRKEGRWWFGTAAQ